MYLNHTCMVRGDCAGSSSACERSFRLNRVGSLASMAAASVSNLRFCLSRILKSLISDYWHTKKHKCRLMFTKQRPQHLHEQ
eukprot:COSAG06_NODE_69_length_26016_cov_6.603272_9_plen_82_part_00